MVGPKLARVPGGRTCQQAFLPAFAVCVLAAVGVGCGPATAAVSDLTTLDQLTAEFNQDAGTTRIVLLLAPT
jgi:hypothetical protein